MIEIFSAEADIAEQIQANSSVAYAVQLQPRELTPEFKQSLLSVAQQSEAKIQDLYMTKSLFCSTNWNLNDDVFGIQDSWAARHTPIHKRTNLEHDEKTIVGHITDTWVINEAGELIPDDTKTEDLPDLFHICNGAAIYTKWKDNKLNERTAELIEKIEAGEMFVSMECLFANFDYALIEPDGNFSVLSRNEETSFLTKTLRAYGGRGEYEGYKIGRFLRNFVYSGKGYVSKPANPDSIIFTQGSAINFSEAQYKTTLCDLSGVNKLCKGNTSLDRANSTISTEVTQEIIMSETIDYKKQLDEAKAEMAKLRETLDKVNGEKYETQIASKNEEITKTQTLNQELQTKVEASEKSNAELLETVKTLTEAKKNAEDKIAKIEASVIFNGRVSDLVAAGFSKEDATAKVEKFASLTDEQFKDIAEALALSVKSETPEETVADDKQGEEVAEGSLEVEVEEVLKTTEEDNTDANHAVAQMVDFFGSRTQKTEEK